MPKTSVRLADHADPQTVEVQYLFGVNYLGRTGQLTELSATCTSARQGKLIDSKKAWFWTESSNYLTLLQRYHSSPCPRIGWRTTKSVKLAIYCLYIGVKVLYMLHKEVYSRVCDLYIRYISTI